MARPPAVSNSARVDLEKIATVIVDDNPQSLEILGQVAAGFGIKDITKCLSAARAIETIKRKTVDLLITDASMPEMDGYELIRWVRRESGDHNRFMPVIMVTAHTPQSHVTKARDCGANFIVAKPIAPKQLMERLFWVAKSDRIFIDSEGYIGPDRRFRRLGPPCGMPGRREDDEVSPLGDASGPNLTQDDIDKMMSPTKVAI